MASEMRCLWERRGVANVMLQGFGVGVVLKVREEKVGQAWESNMESLSVAFSKLVMPLQESSQNSILAHVLTHCVLKTQFPCN